ncbi:helix-turn-helix domain-containing protein [Dyadobacter sp. OTU695]|uniref:helix-turn-helix domain-containing protein n=1 Tax=Dyadobacter sp. OTU695 TaxID=3043860 RepID=UPI00313BEF84
MNSEDRRPVLIIDKSIARNSLGSEALAKNFHLMESNNDEEGLAMARELRPDVVVCDISDPSRGGLLICQKLKSDAYTGHVSIILLGPIEYRTVGLQAGADGYISVPFDSHVLMLNIENMIRLRDAMRDRAVQEMWVQSELEGISGRFITKLEQMIFENISDPNFGVKEMAFQMGISVSVLYRRLRFLKGITVNEFVKKIRMQRAMKLLEAGIYPVNEVAASIGYEDSKYFSREFRKFFGKTPMEVKHRINAQ